MRTTAFLLLTTFTMAAANGFSQKISLQMKHARLESVFNRLEKLSGCSFIYEKNLLKKIKEQDVSLQDLSLPDALNTLLKDLPLDFVIRDKFVVISPRAPAPPGAVPAAPLPGVSQQPDIEFAPVTGIVTDSSGAPMHGVTVLNRTTGKTVATDAKGAFAIEAKNGDILVFTYVSFIRQSVTIGAATSLTVVLREDPAQMGTVVITALGIKRREKALTYNIQDIKGDEVTRVPDASFVNSLTGKVAGITINASASGIGGSTRVVMRGDKSVNGNNNALYVLDGIPLPNLFSSTSTTPNGIYGGADGGDGISSINPEDIQSIDVLTGAASAALYGSQAANGVILVNTKSGSSDKTHISFTNSSIFYHPFVMPQFQNTYGTSAPGAFDSWGAKLATPTDYNPSDFFQTGANISNSIGVSTGTDKNRTYFSAAAVNANGIVPNNTFDRYNLTLHNTTKYLDDKITLDLNLMYINSKNKNAISQGQYKNPIAPIYLFPRGDDIEKYQVYERYDPTRNFKIQFWPFGTQGISMQNPYWITNREFNINNKERYMLGATLKYQVLTWLNVTGRVRTDRSTSVSEDKEYASTLPLFAFNSADGSYTISNQHNRQDYADAIASATRRFNNFGLNVNAGASLLNTYNEIDGAGGALLIVPNLFVISNTKPGGSQTPPNYYKNQAIFGTATLDYKNRVFLDLTERKEWSSPLANTGSTSFSYPSAGLSAIISDMVSLPRNVISFLKIRGSYSEVGNTLPQFISNPLSYPVTPSGVTLSPNVPFINLKPERTKAAEIGMNAAFLKNRISLNVTLYNTDTYNQLFTFTAPASSGYSNYYANAGKINNKGIEAALGVNSRFGLVSWTASATFTLNRNKVISLVENKISPLGQPIPNLDTIAEGGTGSYTDYIIRGQSMGSIYVNKLQTDEHGYILVSNTGTIAAQVVSGINDLVYAGNSNPRFTIGFRNGFSYKNINLNFLVSGRFGGVVVSQTQAILDGYGASLASAKARDAGGVVINGAKITAQTYYQTVGAYNSVLSPYVYSATNIRLGEASIGYTLPGSMFNNKIQDLTVSVIGRNLFMFYNKAPYDPEITASTGTFYQGIDYFMLPSLRSFGFSIKANL